MRRASSGINTNKYTVSRSFIVSVSLIRVSLYYVLWLDFIFFLFSEDHEKEFYFIILRIYTYKTIELKKAFNVYTFVPTD